MVGLSGPAVLPVLVPYPINGYGTKEAGGGLATEGEIALSFFVGFRDRHVQDVSMMCPSSEALPAFQIVVHPRRVIVALGKTGAQGIEFLDGVTFE